MNVCVFLFASDAIIVPLALVYCLETLTRLDFGVLALGRCVMHETFSRVH